MRCFLVYRTCRRLTTGDMTHSFLRSFAVFMGTEGVGNPARWNPYSSSIHWEMVDRSTLLHCGDKPVLCYMLGFAKASHIRAPTLIEKNQKYVKNVCLRPFSHEFERSMSSLSGAVKSEPEIRGYGEGVVIATAQRQYGYASDIPYKGRQICFRVCVVMLTRDFQWVHQPKETMTTTISVNLGNSLLRKPPRWLVRSRRRQSRKS